jgi:hypothetical protein
MGNDKPFDRSVPQLVFSRPAPPDSEADSGPDAADGDDLEDVAKIKTNEFTRGKLGTGNARTRFGSLSED